MDTRVRSVAAARTVDQAESEGTGRGPVDEPAGTPLEEFCPNCGSICYISHRPTTQWPGHRCPRCLREWYSRRW
jgi:hypothetical protein